MKTYRKLTKIFLIPIFFFINTIYILALFFPNSIPVGESPQGKINQILTNIVYDCGVGKYIQGFTSSGVLDCKNVASFSTLILSTGHSNATSGSGLFQKYFTKILNDCGVGRYVKGFDSNKNLICEDITKTVTLMGTITSLVSSGPTIVFPAPPSGQKIGGTFTDSFNTIFSANCGIGEYLQGFDGSQNKICKLMNPIILISNCTELQAIGNNATTLAGKYQLVSDIDCSDTVNWNGGLGFKQIGHNSDLFIGTLDGKGYKVTGLYINRPLEDYIGLFGFSFSNSIIKNIGVDGANIIGGNQVGGLIGNPDTSSITNSYTTNSSIKGIQSVGGLAGGCAGSSISNSYATNNTINGSYYIGGLASGTNNCQISNSYATNNTINGSSQIGGLVGYNVFSSISHSYATNNAISGTYSLGGLVGNNSASSISNSYAINNAIIGNQEIGGLVGDNYYDWGSAPITNSYATNNTISDGSSYIGGLVGGGSPLSTSTASYYNKDFFTGATSYGTPKTTGEMIIQGTYVSWDFSADWKPMTGVFAKYYPCLAWQANSTCTKAPNVITNCTELQAIGANLNTKYQLAHDIDCSDTINWNGGLGFKPIGGNSNSFQGTLDGKGYKIIRLYINRPSEDYVGLFGYSHGSGIIKNIGLKGADITGRNQVGGVIGYIYSSSISNSNTINSTIKGSNNIGGLVGYSVSSSVIISSYAADNTLSGSSLGGLLGTNFSSLIVGCSATNNILNGGRELGGLVGNNYSSSSIDTSYARNNNITGNVNLGGLAGNNSTSTISNSYAVNNLITGNFWIGGLVGGNSAAISNSYATDNPIVGINHIGGLVGYSRSSLITSSYYNKDTFTGVTPSGTPKSTSEMISQSIYSGWNFSSTWKQVGTGYYPCLAWQNDSSCIAASISWSCGDSITAGGFTYTTTLGADNKCWTSKNMKHTVGTGNSLCYNNMVSNCDTYGRLYDWTAATDNNLCGALGIGWALPSDSQWNILTTAGATGWTGNKLNGIVSVLAGIHLIDNTFKFQDINGYWWTSSEYLSYPGSAYSHYLATGSTGVGQNTTMKANGYSVICIKN